MNNNTKAKVYTISSMAIIIGAYLVSPLLLLIALGVTLTYAVYRLILCILSCKKD